MKQVIRTCPGCSSIYRSHLQHWSVEFWRQPRGRANEDKADFRELASVAAQSVRRANVLQDTTTAAYWAYHSARWAFFLLQAAGSVVLASRPADLSKGQLTFTSGVLDASASSRLAWNLSTEAFGTFECDLRNIKEGAYKLPWDMTTLGHRQTNPLYVLRQSILYFREARQVLGRRREPEGQVGVVPFERSNLYPDYYQNNFHFQTDGWFSSQSADAYEVTTESLFFGRQDAMQRGTLLAMNRYFPGSNGAGLAMLEVGAGTGRLATFVRDNYPAARLTVSDLSPFYLEKARSNMAYWQRCASPSARSAGSVSFLQCAAEALPHEDACMDVVYCVYMFHEVPDDARRAALREFARVLKPGGVLIITDSIQEGDRPALTRLRAFSAMNEPHYTSYVDFSFATELQAAGLQPDFKSLSSSTKTITAVKR
eukprot:jgi/Ulvmu1/2961/UM015_0001.1